MNKITIHLCLSMTLIIPRTYKSAWFPKGYIKYLQFLNADLAKNKCMSFQFRLRFWWAHTFPILYSTSRPWQIFLLTVLPHAITSVWSLSTFLWTYSIESRTWKAFFQSLNVALISANVIWSILHLWLFILPLTPPHVTVAQPGKHSCVCGGGNPTISRGAWNMESSYTYISSLLDFPVGGGGHWGSSNFMILERLFFISQ